MIDKLTISIPVELARFAVSQRTLATKYQVNEFIRAIDTWLVLKHVTRSGLIKNWNKQKSELLQLCKCSEAVFRSRLTFLKQKNFLHYDRNSIQICAYSTLAKILEIDCKKKFAVEYSTGNKQRLQEWIIATEIQDNQQRQNYMILKQVNKNPQVEAKLVNAMVADGADRSRLNDADYFLGQMRALYLQDFVVASKIHEILITIRPDNNRGVKAIARAWNAKHPQTISYWKKILSAAGVIDVSKLFIVSADRVRNTYCKVIWDKKNLQTVLRMPDNIQLLQPWLGMTNYMPA